MLRILSRNQDLREKVLKNAVLFKRLMTEAGFSLLPGDTAIVPVMLYDEKTALAMADKLLEKGIYVIGFAYPVVPKGKARIRVQLSAAHTEEDIVSAVKAFKETGKELGII